jgi:hypothetical protein
MKHFFSTIVILLLCGNLQAQNAAPKKIEAKITAEELKLYKLIMDYRKSKKFPVIPLSKSLTYVAQVHSKDLDVNHPDVGNCNMHSWSKKGKWKSCCYTDDHKQAKCMWDKPRELTNYTGDGFEISTYNSEMNASQALESWKGRVHHNNVIINQDIWKDTRWNAIGIGINGTYAVVWFGSVSDQEGEPAR